MRCKNENYFLLASQKIVEFDLIDFKKIENLQIYNEVIAQTFLKKLYKEQTLANFHELLKHYMGGDFSVKEYINHIIEYGFYSPYQKNMDIVIECE